MSQLILIIILVVLADALCSCLEASFFTVSLAQARLFAQQGKRGAQALLKIKERIQHTIITLVILSNAVTIVGSIFVGYVATQIYGSEVIGIISAILTTLIIMLGEILPKLIGENYAKPIALAFAPAVYIITKFFTPITYLVEHIMQSFIRKNKVVSEDELKMLSEMGEAEGSIERDERELIQRVFTLNDLTAKNIMTPRTVIEGLPANSPVRDVAVVLTHKPYSRYPVFVDSIDKIVGVVQTSKILAALVHNNDKELVSHFMTTPVFVSEKKRVDDLLALFLSTRNHMAVVQDEFGGTVGVVTFEDVLEQLVGEIMDETDEVADLQKHARDAHTKTQ
ncbi:MAG: HlyC/CorC family transporter [Candidatus Pacebacteria bacterium]|nr:HlyC/CorC family transporter [Candidatus Paceibacterota bacterium]